VAIDAMKHTLQRKESILATGNDINNETFLEVSELRGR
jgi:hypothetical protein